MPGKKSSYEDLQEKTRGLKMPEIEVWENQYPEKEFTVRLSYPEFTCVCPKTGLPDFAVINLEYVPQKLCVELRSLKMYFIAYRGVGIFHEHLVNKILEDFVSACRPRRARVEGVVNSRGGIQTTVTAEYIKGVKRKPQDGGPARRHQ
jgi:7-cyano-7-deazaguanine reductase